MKKTLIAALASLMLAGALSAVAGANPVSPSGTVLMVGDGVAPVPLGWPSSVENRDASSPNQ